MSRTVIILGAGASVDAGAPLMASFLDRAEDYLSQGKLRLSSKQIGELFLLRSNMRLVYANSTLDLQNIESLLSALEMGITIGGIGDYSKQKLDTLQRAAEHMIVQTIEESVEFGLQEGRTIMLSSRGPQSEMKLAMPGEYMSFLSKAKQAFGTDVGFITFNYDVALDLALLATYNSLDYCLGGADASEQATIPLCKLHGSVNWAIHPSTRKLEVVDLRKYLDPLPLQRKSDDKIRLRFSSDFNAEFGGRYRPVIVPPTWNKTNRHRSIPSVWASAAKLLRGATRILIIGYSLPPSDSFFQHMFAISTMQNDGIRRLVVSDIDPNVEKRFRSLIGPGIQSRFAFQSTSFRDIGRHSNSEVFK